MDHITGAAPESAEDILDSLQGLITEEKIAILRNAVRDHSNVC